MKKITERQKQILQSISKYIEETRASLPELPKDLRRRQRPPPFDHRYIRLRSPLFFFREFWREVRSRDSQPSCTVFGIPV